MKYTSQRICLYESTWDALYSFMQRRGLPHFDMTVGLAFLQDECNITVFTCLPTHQRLRVRAINMLGEYQLHRHPAVEKTSGLEGLLPGRASGVHRLYCLSQTLWDF